MPFSVIAALGNPGREYSTTRHNAGWMVIDTLAAQAKAEWKKEERFNVAHTQITLGNQSIHLIKPLSFMNNSGLPIASFLRFYRIEPSEVVVMYDDIAFEPGQMRLSVGGSAAGHHGVESCLQHCGDGFVRARLGIGAKQHPSQDLASHVLGNFPAADFALFQQRIPDFIQGLTLLISRGLPAAQNFTNRKTPLP